jgi:uncharacterized phage protein gp47/JayE
MSLPVRSFTTIVRDMAAAITASAGELIDVSVGSVLRALIESNAAIVLWIQWLILLTLQSTRAATCTGVDLDTWMADFSLLRLPAVAATGIVTFSRFSGTAAAAVPVSTLIKTQDGSVTFVVIADPSNLAWQASKNAYALAIGVMAIDLPIIATVAGISGNVLPNTITLLASAVPGIDVLNNQLATSEGMAEESDDAFRSRFTNFLAARSRATLDAIGYAISLVGSDLSYVVQENVDAAGNARAGNILIVVDDGSGTIAGPLFDSLALAIEAVRPVGTIFSIQPPRIIQVAASLALEYPPGLSVSNIEDFVRSALETYINSRKIGSTLSVTRISQLVYRIEPKIINISSVMLNGLGVDLVAPPTTAFQFLSISFT